VWSSSEKGEASKAVPRASSSAPASTSPCGLCGVPSLPGHENTHHLTETQIRAQRLKKTVAQSHMCMGVHIRRIQNRFDRPRLPQTIHTPSCPVQVTRHAFFRHQMQNIGKPSSGVGREARSFPQSAPACVSFLSAGGCSLRVLSPRLITKGLATHSLCSSRRIVNEKQHFTIGWSDVSLGFLREQAVKSVSWAGSNAIVPNSSQ